MIHHTRVCINLRAYERNLKHLIAALGDGVSLCAVVKADAYGHGLERIAPAAVKCGAAVLGIADNWEAERIRGLGIQTRLLRLRPVAIEEAREALAWDVEEIVGDMECADGLSKLGLERQRPIPVHLKLDAGIGRMSFSLPRDLERVRRVCQLPGIAIVGVMTHFPCADEDDSEITLGQLDRFNQNLASLDAFLPPNAIRHTANSAAALRYPQSRFDMARLGIITYGLLPSSAMKLDFSPQPVMQWKTTVVQIRNVPQGSSIGYGMTIRLDRDRRIATLPLGYADGFLRAWSNNADVLIRGIRCPVVGRVSMNLVIVDVSDLPDARVGDEVVLLGEQGNESITADELAERAGTIHYEITCLVGRCNSFWIVDCE